MFAIRAFDGVGEALGIQGFVDLARGADEAGDSQSDEPQEDPALRLFRIQPPGRMYSRWRGITVQAVAERFSGLTATHPKLLDAAIRLHCLGVGFNLHYNNAIDYRRRGGNLAMQETMRMGALVSVMTRLPSNSRERRTRSYATHLMYGGIGTHPGLRGSPYAQVYDIPCGRVAPSVSETRHGLLVSYIVLSSAMYAFFKLIGVWDSIQGGDGLTAVVASTFALSTGWFFPFLRNGALATTWPLHVRQTYEGVERYGIDGFIAMAMEPWRVFTILRRLKALEKRGLLDSRGFTEQGAMWYVGQMQPAVSFIKSKRDVIMDAVK